MWYNDSMEVVVPHFTLHFFNLSEIGDGLGFAVKEKQQIADFWLSKD